MLGLSVVLEAQKVNATTSSTSPKTTPHVINKVITIKPPSSSTTTSSSPKSPPFTSTTYYPSSSFLESCFLCHEELSPSEDIYMYLGDRAFCSVECRYTQICMDEKQQKFNSSTTTTSATAASAASAASASKNKRRDKWPHTTVSAPIFFA